MSNMMGVMWQQALRRKKKATVSVKIPEQEKDKKEGEGASIFATTNKGDYNCFCCGSSKCWLHRCPKKNDLPPDKWYNPEYAKKKAEEKVSSATTTTTTTSVVTAQYLEQEDVSSDNNTVTVFIGAQTVWLDDQVIVPVGVSVSLLKFPCSWKIRRSNYSF